MSWVPSSVSRTGAECSKCPVEEFCLAHQRGAELSYPVKKRRKQEGLRRNRLYTKDGENIALHKRPSSGLLAGLYEFPNVKGKLTQEEAIHHIAELGLSPLRIQNIGEAKHIFSHVEWHMTGYAVRVDELEKISAKNLVFAHPEEIQKEYPVPAAFEAYTDQIGILIGQEKYEQENL